MRRTPSGLTMSLRGPRTIVTMVVAVLALAIPSVALAGIVTYYSAAFCGAFSGGDTSGLAVRDWNRVYRPVGNLFKLYYGTGSTYYDTWSNPFVSPNSPSSTSAGCRNQTINTVTSVTCQTTTP